MGVGREWEQESHSRTPLCGSMVDMQCAAAEIRRGNKEEERRKIEITGQKYDDLPNSIGRP